MRTRLTSFVGARVARETRTAFVRHAKKRHGVSASEAMRELIVAFIEDRITVAPTKPKEFLK